MKGRKPTPIEQRQAEGTLRAHHAQTPVIVGDRTRPVPGWYMTAGQKRHFDELVDQLVESNLLDSADRYMIELAAIELDLLARCNWHLARSLTVKATRGGYNGSTERTAKEPSPFLKMREDAVQKLRFLYAELGIGPVARATIANRGGKGKPPAKTLPGVGAKPTPLTAVK